MRLSHPEGSAQPSMTSMVNDKRILCAPFLLTRMKEIGGKWIDTQRINIIRPITTSRLYI